MNENLEARELLPPLDLAPRPAALPPELWALHEMETRTHRPAWQPPPRKPVIERKPPIVVPRWLAVAAVLCALYAAVRHNGYAVECGRLGDAVQCRVIAQPAPWRKPS